jgi:hypothetical protein
MPDGQEVVLVDVTTGLPADPVLMDGNSGKRLDHTSLRSVPPPTQIEKTRRQQ